MDRERTRWPAILLALAAVAGCATGFRRARLEPVATRDTGERPYVQVRELGFGELLRWPWSDNVSQSGVTVDIHNGSSAPLTIDLGGATLSLESVGGPEKVLVHAIAAGSGGLPSRVDVHVAAPRPVTLAAGEERTLWLVFDRFIWPNNARATLRLTTAGEDSAVVVLRNPATGRPRWTFEPEGTRGGIPIRVETQLFDTRGYTVALGSGLWLSRGPFRVDLGGWVGSTYARGFNAIEAGTAAGLGLSVVWHPLPWLAGIYGSGGMGFTDFSPQSGLQDKSWSPSVSFGLESYSQAAAPLVFFRLGYVHLFEDSAGRKDGVSIAIGRNLCFW